MQNARARKRECDKKRSVGIYMKETFGIDIAENTAWGEECIRERSRGFGDAEFRTEGYGKGHGWTKKNKKDPTSLEQVPKDNKKDNEMEEKCIMDVELTERREEERRSVSVLFSERDDTRRRGDFAPYSYILDAGVRGSGGFR